MDKLVVLLYDLSAVLIILMTVAYSAQKGFATGIFRLLGRLAALFGSAFLAKNGAELVYDQFLKTEVTAFLSQNLQGGQLTDIIAQLQAVCSSCRRSTPTSSEWQSTPTAFRRRSTAERRS